MSDKKKYVLNKEKPGTNDFTKEFYQTLKKNPCMPTLLNSFPNTQ